AAEESPGAPALRCGGREVTYEQLDLMASQAAAGLARAGVGHGDRVGLWLGKSAAAVAAMQGALRLGAAYVPVDPMSPAARAGTILSDCAVAAVVTTAERAASLEGTAGQGARCLSIDDRDGDLQFAGAAGPNEPPARGPVSEGSAQDLAFILYTSGSTGRPKGVCISHRAALAFVDWSVALVGAGPDDRFSNHAPFHFDLSVFDLYASFAVGACTCIVPEASAFSPRHLVDFLTGERITVWYSVPSALVLMMEHGGLLEVAELPLRHLLFAGEPFPIRHVRSLRERWPALPMHNLYGPTETNVCTAFTVGEIEQDRTRPPPIGRAACGDRVWAVTDDGREAAAGEVGELHVSGPTVMLGYWGHPPQGDRPYPTGDVVRRLDTENFDYLGRRDHMLKVRGHRIEAGEVESSLLTHPEVREAAVVVGGEGLNARLFAFLVGEAGGDGELRKPPSLIALKQHCAARLPRSMIIDAVRWLPELPRTGNGKIDRLTLTRLTTEQKRGPP
ncbi:MAG TPA: amino acid adenylation domain-containing protein, partial [Candidatus Acidoferrum sp.]|nr:amino acid adenylation domain-containing protein [Candidatus Acidoferrum sp.]